MVAGLDEGYWLPGWKLCEALWVLAWVRRGGRNASPKGRLEPLRIFEEEEKREQGVRSPRRGKTNEKQAFPGSQLAAIRPPTPTMRGARTAFQPQLMEVEKSTRIWVIFSGTGSVETQFQRQFKGCEVMTVEREREREREILSKWDPLHAAAILKWDYRQYSRHYFDVIWTSPPCTEYIKAKTTGKFDIKTANRRVQRTKAIIDDFYDPACYFIENPTGDVYAVLRALLHHQFCELHLSENIEDVNAVLEHISRTTMRTYTEDFNENHVEDLP
eukprot:gene34319-biopygen25407